MRGAALILVLLLRLWLPIQGQLSKPIAHDKNMEERTHGNKFMNREASDDLLGYPNLDEEALTNSKCPRHVELRWQAEVSASIYATPAISDINGDGKLDVIVPSFVHYLDVLEGSDGEKLPGWPAFHQAIVHASPLVHDIDKDGMKEILLPTYAGEILIFRSSGFNSDQKFTVPKLRVLKSWYVGLDPDYVDRSHPDVHDESLISKPGNQSYANIPAHNQTNVPKTDSSNGNKEDSSNKTDSSNKEHSANKVVDDTVDAGAGFQMAAAGLNRSVRRLQEQHKMATVDENEELNEDAAASFEVFRDQGEGVSDEYSYDYDDYVDESMWGDDHWKEILKEEDYVNVDAHILCTPVIADIDKDGVDELIVAASHFFDREHYQKPENLEQLGKDVDIGKYVGGAIVVFNMDTKQVKWSSHLDLSTDSVNYRAYIYSAPTVVDLDGSGYLSILVGTSLGFVYALHHNGTLRANFPRQMGEIHAQVVAADINDDGKVEFISCDTRGNVAAWNSLGNLLWEVHLKSMIAQAATVGDVDADGKTDVVIPTASGNIYVLKGTDGSFIKPFPVRAHGRIMSSVLLVNFNKRDSEYSGLTLVTTSFDGYLYLIDGISGCADAIDIGETSYSMVLAENVDGGDDLDLIVTTMNGNVYCFQTPIVHHPLKAWPMHSHGRNVMTPRYDREGIYALPSSRKFRDEAGTNFLVLFQIVDRHELQGPYNVTVTLNVPGNYQGKKKLTQNRIYERPGSYKVRMDTVPVRTAGTVVIEMVDKHGFYFNDEFSLTFHTHYYRLLKWLILLPMLGMIVAVAALDNKDPTALPSFSNSRQD